MELGHPSGLVATTAVRTDPPRCPAARQRLRCYVGKAAEPSRAPRPHGIARAAMRRPMTERERQQFLAIELVTDATALLWKLDLLGVDVGVRWELVADRWDAVGPMGDYAYNAWIAMMAFVGASREGSQRQTLINLKVTSLGWGDAAFFAKECGMAAAQAILAFGAGRYAETVDLLRPLRRCMHRFGGDRARRDLLDLTLVEAAIRSGQNDLASALVAERARRAARASATRSTRLALVRTDA